MGKEYELKALAGLSRTQRIIVTGKKFSKLVPRLLEKMKRGFIKFLKASGMVVGGIIAAPVVLAAKGATMAASAIANKTSEMKQSVVDSVNNMVTPEEIAAAQQKRVDPVNQKMAAEKATMGMIQQRDEFRIGDKQYILHAYQADITKLYQKKKRIINRPKFLMISKLYLSKLIQNSKAKRQERKAQKADIKELVGLAKVSSPEQLKELIELANKQRQAQQMADQYQQMANGYGTQLQEGALQAGIPLQEIMGPVIADDAEKKTEQVVIALPEAAGFHR